MKRSDMVLFIMEHLIEPKSDNIEKAAGALLKTLEDKGMLPPIEPGRRVEDLDLGVPEWEYEGENHE